MKPLELGLTPAAPEDPPELERIPRRILYAPVTAPGAKELWKDSGDNPMSPSFIPLDKRGPMGQARWWARFSRKTTRPTSGVFD